MLALVPDQQPCERQRYVEGVLAVVVDGVDAVEARHLAGKQPLEVLEGLLQGQERVLGPGRAKERRDRAQHRLR